MVRSLLKKIFSPEQRLGIRKNITFLKTLGNGSNLTRLAELYGTDKTASHYYTPHYQHHFAKFRRRRINLLEIGVGGYENPQAGGNSLRMWKRYFPFGRIYSIDVFDKSAIEENRIRIFRGSQVDKEFLQKVHRETGDFDLIIDDGSHVNEDVIESFKLLFPKLKEGGIYAIEDTQTSYWENYGGSNDLNDPKTSMNFFKRLADSLNNTEFIHPGYQQSYFDKKVISVHFYHNLIFVYKGNNDESSNLITDNQPRRL
jgi:demethylmacrocin O-methyltransferase